MFIAKVSIFDNMQTFFEQIVYITKNIGHCLKEIPDLIGNALVSVSDVCQYCPPFITQIILIMFGTGIIMKCTHWGN